MVAVGIASHSSHGQRVGGEDDVAVEAANAFGQDVEERPVVVPALDEDELGPALQRALQPLPVASDREARVVRCEHEPDEHLGSALECRLDRLGDSRPPVLHADEDRRPELLLERSALRLGDLVERRAAADPAVALGQLVDRLLRDRTALADVRQIRGHVLGGRWTAVRHQNHRGVHAATFAVRS